MHLRRSLQQVFYPTVLVLFCWMESGFLPVNSYTPHTSDDNPECFNFTQGHAMEFYSPNYPRLYPSSVECIRIIAAPPEKTIRLDFLTHFSIEPSDECQHDFLEIRDGPHGAADLIGRYCGERFPSKITSRGRYLWLRFVSDSDIEYIGFRAVFTFLEPSAKVIADSSSKPCWYDVTDSAGSFSGSSVEEYYRNYTLVSGVALDCIWKIEAEPQYQLSIYFLDFKLKSPNNCTLNFVEIYYKEIKAGGAKITFCGSAAQNFTSSSSVNVVFIRLFAQAAAIESEFKMQFNRFRSIKPAQGESCYPDSEFDCKDSTCIDQNLRCNNFPNCKHNNDEEKCSTGVLSKAIFERHVWIILGIGLGLLLALLISMCWSFYHQWQEMNEAKEEMKKRHSVAGELDQLGTSGDAAGQTNTAVSILDDDHGCYVPEVDLSIFHKRSNGGSAIAFDQETNFEKMDSPYQRRDSGASNTIPPPPLVASSTPNATDSCLQNNRTNTMNSFLDDEDEAADIFPPPPARQDSRRFKAEALVQMSQQKPRSFESTKSAPDVIGRH